MRPHLYANLRNADTVFWKSVIEIPGVKRKGERISVPADAMEAVSWRFQARPDVQVMRHWWFPKPLPSLSWDQVVQVLRAGGEVKPEFLDGYALPFQQEALAMMATRSGLLHHPTGAGKTFQFTAWACLFPGTRVIVTKGATRLQVAKAVEKYTKLAPFILLPASLVRKKDRWHSVEEYLAWCAQEGQSPVIVMGQESLPHLASAMANVPIVSLVVDESHRLKSPKRWSIVPLPKEEGTKVELDGLAAGGKVLVDDDGTRKMRFPLTNRATVIKALADRAARVLLATATPIHNQIRDLYGQLSLISDQGSWSDWSAAYADAKPSTWNINARDTSGMSRAPELLTRMRCLVHAVHADVVRAQLPAFNREPLYVDPSSVQLLTPAQELAFQAQMKAAVTYAAKAEVQIARAVAVGWSAVLDVVEERIQAGHKGVLFTTRKDIAAQLHKAVKTKHKGIPVFVGTGDHAFKARLDMKDAYIHAEGAAVLIGTGDAWGTGIDDLQIGTDYAIFVGFPPIPGDIEQWEGRFPRLGQVNPITLYYLIVEGTILEHYASIAIRKTHKQAVVAASGALAGLTNVLGGHEADPEAFAQAVLASIAKNAEDAEDSEMEMPDLY